MTPLRRPRRRPGTSMSNPSSTVVQPLIQSEPGVLATRRPSTDFHEALSWLRAGPFFNQIAGPYLLILASQDDMPSYQSALYKLCAQ